MTKKHKQIQTVEITAVYHVSQIMFVNSVIWSLSMGSFYWLIDTHELWGWDFVWKHHVSQRNGCHEVEFLLYLLHEGGQGSHNLEPGTIEKDRPPLGLGSCWLKGRPLSLRLSFSIGDPWHIKSGKINTNPKRLRY